MIKLDKLLGATKTILSEHMFSEEIKNEMERFPSMSVIGLGQGGGRIAAEFSRFGFPTYLVNSSKSDMDEHHFLIPEEKRIITKSENYPELEGTDKNAQLGFEIAKENQDIYKKLAISDDVQNADFVWVCVSLGGGTGNGALKVALAYLSQVRQNRMLPDGRIPLGIICSLPSKDERGSSFRRNALAGISLLQSMINTNKIGSVLVIDNEKMNDYYANSPLKTYGGTEIDAKSYGNMLVASLTVEIASLPLLQGRSVFDKTEYLGTISTAGWLSVSKLTDIQTDDNLEKLIRELYTKSEVLAENTIESVQSGAIAVLYPTNKNMSPKIADDVYSYASEQLNAKVHRSISANSKLKYITLYGLTVANTPPVRISHIQKELIEWERIEKEQEEKKQNVSESLGLDEFNDFFSGSTSQNKRRGNISLSSLDEMEDNNPTVLNNSKVAAKVSVTDLKNIDF
ncbi:cell division protein FtsZ [Psychrobacillus sp. FSL H8-0484]|uniref:cell division protein FtsZ n=1 Tax=Psychrobacillus sp. FSL H8-0484 TaxID=2921390 RepID=UPI0030FA9285